PVNWRHVQAEATRGTPVIVSTPNHYFVVDDFDPVTGELHVGQSGLAFRGGAEWMTVGRIQQLGGGVNGALYIDHPLPPRLSLPPMAPFGDVPRTPGHAATDTLRSDRWWEDSRVVRPVEHKPRQAWA